jgi:surfeit locus 1 family protein
MNEMPTLSRGQRVVVLLATLAAVALTANLGAWQLRRAAQKTALKTAMEQRAALPALPVADLAQTPLEAEAQHHRRIVLKGRWLADRTVWLENRQMNGYPGFFVVTPLQLAGSPRVVLVQRGWAPRNIADRSQLPPVTTPAGEVTINGRIAPPPARLYEPGPAASGAIRQNLDLAAFARETGLPLAPLSVVQDAAPPGESDGLVRQWALPAIDVHMHHGYAAQWFALSALMAGLYVWFQLVRPRLRRSA